MHKYYLLAALEQAWLGRGVCAPNPSVGAVVVHNDKIIARAWHRGAGTSHAEQLVLDDLPIGLEKATLYVTLEPCNHWGRTPPCVDAIIHHKISQVVYGFFDPNPIVAENDTPKLLRQHHIDVVHYPLPEIDEFYRSYKYWTTTQKPWVTAKIAQTLNGKIAGAQGERVFLSNQRCFEFTHYCRLYSDIILTSARTITQDNPLLNVRLAEKKQAKCLAIIDSTLSLTQQEKVFQHARSWHIFYDSKYKAPSSVKNCVYHPIKSTNGLLDLHAIIKTLGALGFHDVWVEVGGKLFSALHNESLVQRTYLYITPHLLENNAMPAFSDETMFKRRKQVSWQVKEDNVIGCIDWHEDESA